GERVPGQTRREVVYHSQQVPLIHSWSSSNRLSEPMGHLNKQSRCRVRTARPMGRPGAATDDPAWRLHVGCDPRCRSAEWPRDRRTTLTPECAMAKAKAKKAKESTASALAAAGGAAAGAAAGSVLGPLGAAVGAVIGGV